MVLQVLPLDGGDFLPKPFRNDDEGCIPYFIRGADVDLDVMDQGIFSLNNPENFQVSPKSGIGQFLREVIFEGVDLFGLHRLSLQIPVYFFRLGVKRVQRKQDEKCGKE